ncbi:MAG: hypothetical protein KC478_11035, partial [Bacteriovoracaceae bacterium]|nr:hypothetical protein [Bacteriovoracaceae bacterium]
SHVSDDARRWVGTYKNLCAQSQNEKNNSDDEFEDGGKDYIKEECEGSDSESILSDIDSQLKTYGNLTDEQVEAISSASSYGQENIKEILEEVEGNSSLVALIKNRIKLANANKAAMDKFNEYFEGGASNQVLLSSIAGVTEPAEKENIAREAATKARNISDKGFCSTTRIKSLIESTRTADKIALVKIDDDIENTSAMKTAGRAIASLKQNTAKDPLSAMGQAEYQDIDCEATASAGRFSDSFDFNLDPMGQSSQLGNFSLGK